MNPITVLDQGILDGLDAFARKSWIFDRMVSALADNDLLKGGVIMAAFWWAWFRTRADGKSRDREHVIATIIGCLAALALGRLLVVALPFRIRPIYETSFAFVVPYGVNLGVLAKASSFPSDHAVLFFGLAAGLYHISRPVGLLAAVYTALLIALPRMYLGLHYFSDIVAGGVIGAAVCCVANRVLPATCVVQVLEQQVSMRPMWFYPALFLVTFEITELFESTRSIVGGLFKIFR
ncbi:phosphatase PAP2 family protein [Ramlibacter sp. MMS24-I3-19]|uniref:phosphatase PAP2 family protein n=1 Tax=Ramlibacter sp. MMS24-I3-19 TaxID=3416606 RepID=UPI003D042DE6